MHLEGGKKKTQTLLRSLLRLRASSKGMPARPARMPCGEGSRSHALYAGLMACRKASLSKFSTTREIGSVRSLPNLKR